MAGVEYQVTKVDPTDPHTKGAVYQVHEVSEEVAATLGGKVYRARIIKDPTEPTVVGKVYQIVLIDDPDDPAVKGKVYNAILTGGSEAVVVGPAVSPLDLPDASAELVDSLIAYGGIEQNGTPTPDAPVDIVCNNGALKVRQNLWKGNYADKGYLDETGAVIPTSGYMASDFIEIDQSKKYTFYEQIISTYTVNGMRICFYNSSKQMVGQRQGGSAVNPGSYAYIAIPPASAKYIRVSTGADASNVTSITLVEGEYNTTTIQGVVGSIYTDGTVETISITHNEFNPNDESRQFSGFLTNAAVGNTVSLTGYAGGDKCLIFPVKAGDTYRFTRPLGISAVYDRIRVAASVEYPTTSSTLLIIFNKSNDRETTSAVFTIPEGYNYVVINVRNSGTVGTDWQMYLDGVSFCNLSEQVATCEDLFALGDYTDEQEVVDGIVTRNVGVKVLDGTENWTASSNYFGSCYTYVLGETPVGQVICSHFQNTSSLSDYSRGKCYKETGAFNLWYGDNIATAIADLKQFLADQYAAGTPVIVIYTLATATTESVTAQPMQTVEGANTVEITQASIGGLELKVAYRKRA